MIDPHGVLLPDPLLDPLVERARAALTRQSSALVGVQRQIEGARVQLPSDSGGGWTGPAQEVYELGLRELGRAVDRARDSVGSALLATDLALDSLARHGG